MALYAYIALDSLRFVGLSFIISRYFVFQVVVAHKTSHAMPGRDSPACRTPTQSHRKRDVEEDRLNTGKGNRVSSSLFVCGFGLLLHADDGIVFA